MNLSYEGLKQCSDELHNSYKNIKEILENISNISEQIKKSGCWEGSASDYYTDKLKNLSSNFDEVYLELEKSALYLDKIIEGYENFDKKVLGNIGLPNNFLS